MKKALALTSLATFALPLIAAAQAINNLTEAGNFLIEDIINGLLVPLLFAVAFITFLWGVFKAFILGANDEDAKAGGKNLMLYGLIGFFVMLSLWGLVKILTGSVDLENTQPDLPSAEVGG
jgi:hypothetical protein